MSPRRLVADAGGTNVRFAVADEDGRLDRIKIFQTTDFPTFLDAFSAYRSDAGGLPEIDACAIAAAGPVDGDAVKLTNNEWIVDRAKIAAMMGGVPVALVNDLEAVAAALPHLTSDDLTTLGAPAPVRPERRTMLAVNVGTGFGAASVIWRDGRWYTCPSEAGHMTLGRVEAMAALPADASVEDVLSGSGLARLHARLAGGQAGSAQQAADVFAVAGRDAAAAAHGGVVHRHSGTHRRGPRARHLRVGRCLPLRQRCDRLVGDRRYRAIPGRIHPQGSHAHTHAEGADSGHPP